MKRLSVNIFGAIAVLTAGFSAWSQGCQTRDQISAQAKTTMENAAQQVFEQASKADVSSLRANAIPPLQSNFGGIAAAVNDNKAAFVGARPQLRSDFLLDTGPTPSAEGRFFCGAFGANGQTANGAEFDIPGLPAGKYAIVIQDFIGGKGPYALTTIFQEMSGWKLAGFYIRPESAAGHDGIWYLLQARDYKAKGKNHNAWFYYVTSWDLLAPVTFMDSSLLSKILQESNDIRPKDVPVGDKVVDFSANGKIYSVIDMSTFRTDTTFDLSIRYTVSSTADFNATQADARSLGNALAVQYPELKEGFNNILVHAVDASGGDVAGLVKLKPAAKP
jgi:hypothetical protein